jgi:ATP-binding cassette subfamily F protein 3
MKYDGAMVIVSHDRSFLKGLTNKVYEFKDKGVKQHIGDVYEFLAKSKMVSLEQLGFNARKETNAVPDKKSTNKEDYKAKKEREKKLRVAKNKASKLEKEIEALEAEIASLDELMLDAAAFKKAQEERDVFKEYQQKQDALETKMTEWEEAVEVADELDNQ